ncbi:MAG: SDR family NAD(P)-dependent oxidoreductase [Lentisphaeria bacterium]|nr:SDR family NAD(P)-dependent oxidoreductase [Lentisphaeria bacterium]
MAADFFPDNLKWHKPERILVTGGAGFIGSALVETLLNNGIAVTCMDNFSTGRKENIAPFMADPRFTLLEADIRDPEACRCAMEGAEYVLHEAALGSVPRSIADPESSIAVNVSGTVNIFAAANRAGVKRVVYASSSSVYGTDTSAEKVENRTGETISPYAASKSACEYFAANFARVYGLECVGLRYFNVFGPRQNPAGAYAAVIPKFAAAMLAHQSPVINGDGKISRDFTFIGNVVRANLLALATPGVSGEVFNVGCGESHTLDELFAGLRDALSKFDPETAAISPVYGAPRPGDVPFSLASVAKAQKMLGYEALFDFDSGLRETAEYFFRTTRR